MKYNKLLENFNLKYKRILIVNIGNYEYLQIHNTNKNLENIGLLLNNFFKDFKYNHKEDYITCINLKNKNLENVR